VDGTIYRDILLIFAITKRISIDREAIMKKRLGTPLIQYNGINKGGSSYRDLDGNEITEQVFIELKTDLKKKQLAQEKSAAKQVKATNTQAKEK